jgi:hypothetical protein
LTGGRLEKGTSVQETMDWIQRDGAIFRGTPTMMQLEKALATIKGGITGISLATELFTHGIGGKDCSGDGRGVKAFNKIGATIGQGYMQIGFGTRVMELGIGNAKGRNMRGR